MTFDSLYPPVCVQGPSSGRWYIIADGVWTQVGRKYTWSELESMWTKRRPAPVPTPKPAKLEWAVEGSKGNTYTVVNDNGNWTCSCPAHGFGRGKDCKHIAQIKAKK